MISVDLGKAPVPLVAEPFEGSAASEVVLLGLAWLGFAVAVVAVVGLFDLAAPPLGWRGFDAPAALVAATIGGAADFVALPDFGAFALVCFAAPCDLGGAAVLTIAGGLGVPDFGIVGFLDLGSAASVFFASGASFTVRLLTGLAIPVPHASGGLTRCLKILLFSAETAATPSLSFLFEIKPLSRCVLQRKLVRSDTCIRRRLRLLNDLQPRPKAKAGVDAFDHWTFG